MKTGSLSQEKKKNLNMAEYKKDYPELYFLEDLTTDASMLDWEAMTTAFVASARQSSQLDNSIYKATFEHYHCILILFIIFMHTQIIINLLKCFSSIIVVCINHCKWSVNHIFTA